MFESFAKQIIERLGEGARVFRAPGRLNIIGEHTDYNDGFVLPGAIDREVRFAIRQRSDRLVNAYSVDYHAEATFSLDEIRHDESSLWSNYLRGICQVLQIAGYPLNGADLVFSGTVPKGAGLSSSAALEVAAATAFLALSGISLPGEEIARLANKAENSFVGTQCGIMDMFISALGKSGHALLLDCRSLTYRAIPVPTESALIIIDSGVRRELVSSAYNTRRLQCENGVKVLRNRWPEIQALRDATLPQLDDVRKELDADEYKRCRHVITENSRVEAAAAALEQGDLNKVGELLFASHHSLRDDFEVSCLELDMLVEIAIKQQGIYGARMTGAGFGGCIVSLVAADCAEEIALTITREYESSLGKTAKSYVSKLADGAGELFLG